MKLVAIQPSEGDRDRAFSETQTVLKVHPNVKVIMAIAAPAVPGAAEAVKQSGRTDVKVIGLSLPNMCQPYIKAGVIDSIVLWNTMDLGALAVRTAEALTTGELKAGRDVARRGEARQVRGRGRRGAARRAVRVQQDEHRQLQLLIDDAPRCSSPATSTSSTRTSRSRR